MTAEIAAIITAARAELAAAVAEADAADAAYLALNNRETVPSRMRERAVARIGRAEARLTAASRALRVAYS